MGYIQLARRTRGNTALQGLAKAVLQGLGKGDNGACAGIVVAAPAGARTK
jgi:hypothetical protein